MFWKFNEIWTSCYDGPWSRQGFVSISDETGNIERTASLVIQAMVYNNSEMCAAGASVCRRQQGKQFTHFATMTDFVVCIRCALRVKQAPLLGMFRSLTLRCATGDFLNFSAAAPQVHRISRFEESSGDILTHCRTFETAFRELGSPCLLKSAVTFLCGAVIPSGPRRIDKHWLGRGEAAPISYKFCVLSAAQRLRGSC